MLGVISAVIGVLVLFATQLAFPELNERFKSFSSIRYLLSAGAFAVSTFNGIFFYAEPGFKHHVGTIMEQEKMVSDKGYNTYLFGRVNAWKNAVYPPISSAQGMAIRQQVAIKRRNCCKNSWPWNTPNAWIMIAQSKNEQNLGPMGPIFLVISRVSG